VEDDKNWYGNWDAKFSDLIGKTIVEIDGLELDSDTVQLKCSDGTQFQMSYYDDCCAHCSVEDICGDPKDLLNSPIVKAEESTSDENPEGVKIPEYQDSFTWTFYHLSTVKGTVTLRWYGSSNGYYSESVTFERLTAQA